jgi:hypothetical protein
MYVQSGFIVVIARYPPITPAPYLSTEAQHQRFCRARCGIAQRRECRLQAGLLVMHGVERKRGFRISHAHAQACGDHL